MAYLSLDAPGNDTAIGALAGVGADFLLPILRDDASWPALDGNLLAFYVAADAEAFVGEKLEGRVAGLFGVRLAWLAIEYGIAWGSGYRFSPDDSGELSEGESALVESGLQRVLNIGVSLTFDGL